MKVIIEPGKVPEIYDDDGQLIDGIVSFSYGYVTRDSKDIGKNELNLNYYSSPDDKRLSVIHKGWKLDE